LALFSRCVLVAVEGVESGCPYEVLRVLEEQQTAEVEEWPLGERIKESLPGFEGPAGQWIRRDTMVTRR
jgi:hypothetical protein